MDFGQGIDYFNKFYPLPETFSFSLEDSFSIPSFSSQVMTFSSFLVVVELQVDTVFNIYYLNERTNFSKSSNLEQGKCLSSTTS